MSGILPQLNILCTSIQWK